ncbi:MAG: alpha-glucosidase C-terminal domain-containing protein [Isosphaeraceae bacterium]
MTYVGPPSIYYGDEIGLEGAHDPLNRGAFPWDESTWDHEIRGHTRDLIRLRHDRASLRRGSFDFLYARDDTIAYLRRLGNDAVIIALNAGDRPSRIDLELPADLAGPFREFDTGGRVEAEAGRIRALEVAPRSARILATPIDG